MKTYNFKINPTFFADWLKKFSSETFAEGVLFTFDNEGICVSQKDASGWHQTISKISKNSKAFLNYPDNIEEDIAIDSVDNLIKFLKGFNEPDIIMTINTIDDTGDGYPLVIFTGKRRKVQTAVMKLLDTIKKATQPPIENWQSVCEIELDTALLNDALSDAKLIYGSNRNNLFNQTLKIFSDNDTLKFGIGFDLGKYVEVDTGLNVILKESIGIPLQHLSDVVESLDADKVTFKLWNGEIKGVMKNILFIYEEKEKDYTVLNILSTQKLES